MVGMALFGANGPIDVSVAPARDALIADALWWLRRRAVDRALVNTQLENTVALSLYESCGFRRLPVGLCVLGRTL